MEPNFTIYKYQNIFKISLKFKIKLYNVYNINFN